MGTQRSTWLALGVGTSPAPARWTSPPSWCPEVAVTTTFAIDILLISLCPLFHIQVRAFLRLTLMALPQYHWWHWKHQIYWCYINGQSPEHPFGVQMAWPIHPFHLSPSQKPCEGWTSAIQSHAITPEAQDQIWLPNMATKSQ